MGDEMPNWPLIDREFLLFSQWMNSSSKIIILVREANCQLDSIRELIRLGTHAVSAPTKSSPRFASASAVICMEKLHISWQSRTRKRTR